MSLFKNLKVSITYSYKFYSILMNLRCFFIVLKTWLGQSVKFILFTLNVSIFFNNL